MKNEHYPRGLLEAKGNSSHAHVRDDWLSLRTEAIIDPGRRIIDSHHHLWDRPYYPYEVRQFKRDLDSGHKVVKTVFLECRAKYDPDREHALQSLGETEYVAAMAEAAEGSGIADGIVGFVDLSLGDRAGELLDRHIEASGGRLVGVRNVVAFHADSSVISTVYQPPPHFLCLDAVHAGFEQVGKRGLAFDTWMYHTQLIELQEVAKRFPDVSFIVDHLGGPIGTGPYEARQDVSFREWQASIRQLSRLPNIKVKFSGLGMRVHGFGFGRHPLPPSSKEIAERALPFFETLLNNYGPTRIMFGSNFPVDKAEMSYPVLWNAFKRLASQLSEAEQHSLFYKTAAETYRLDPTESEAQPISNEESHRRVI